MRSSRLVSLLLLLQTRRQMTARELAIELEVSLRTVYRDVDALSAAGIPVYAEQGRAGGYRLVDGYRTRLTGLTDPEAAALFMVGLPGAATALGIGEHTSAAELKLLAALGPGQRESAGRLRDRFHLDIPAWYRADDDEPHLVAISEAVLHDRRIDVVYRRWSEPREVERTLEPHGVVLKSGAWYVVARDHASIFRRQRHGGPHATEAFRTYRVSNILRLTPTDSVFRRHIGFDLAAYWQRSLAELDEQRFTGSATVRLSADLIERLPDFPSSRLARVAAASTADRDDDGSLTVVIPTESVALAATELITHGAGVEVIDPPELRAELVALAYAVATVYADGAVSPRERSDLHVR